MIKKRWVGIIAVIGICAGIIIAGSLLSEKKSAKVLDAKGNCIAELFLENGEMKWQYEEKYKSYIDIVCDEIIDIVMRKEKIDKEKAIQKIVSDKMEINTFCSEKALSGIIEAQKRNADAATGNFAASLSNVKGNLLACYSESENRDNQNYVTTPVYAGSAIKPLSVYTLGIEKGTICWSSMYKDSSYAWIKDKTGKIIEWPVNTKPYTEQKISVGDAVKDSNNAIAVKVLKDVGVEKSCLFLQNIFGISTEKELKICAKKGENNILSNVALGYLENGVTVLQMLEAYQSFANGGVSYQVHAVREIRKNEDVYYRLQEKSERLFGEDTAYIMNRLLRKVVQEGTGTEAQIDDIEVCGKTGTSEYGDHWFVGTTPQYICSVWYKENIYKEGKTSSSARVFKDVIEVLKSEKGLKYPCPAGVCEKRYCQKSGFLAGNECRRTAIGYYKKGVMPGVCDKCKTR